MAGSGTGAEKQRLAAADAGNEQWRAWGPYVAERAWGTVREDYSDGGDAWSYLPYEHARSRAYRWNEDGMAAVCDLDQTWCLGLALWNGVDPTLKERMFGLSGPQGNHGEDVKDYWWYVDSTPTHSWMTWRYHYPQARFPYEDLVAENGRRGHGDPEYELVDTGVFDGGRFWAVTVDYAKAGVDDLCMRITLANRGPDEATLHVLPTLWFRNTWAWDAPGAAVPTITGGAGSLFAEHADAGALTLTGDGDPETLVCDNETNARLLFGTPGRSAFPKDGINDNVVSHAETVNPDGVGTKGSLHYTITVPAGEERVVKVRLAAGKRLPTIDTSYDEILERRKAEADAFFADLTPAGTTADEALVLRQSIAGLLWGKQYFHYNVERWLHGDPAGPVPPASRLTGRNAGWEHFNARDVISMPDPWEYPWFAAWDLAFHCVPLAHVDPQFAKRQLILMLREWYMHPSGKLAAYEWKFDDVNPPVHAWAALRVFLIDGGQDFEFLSRIFTKLLLNFTWWVNRKDSEGNNVFEGGFLGLDNIGPIDRSAVLPNGAHLEQADGTAWMAMYSLNLLEIALRLAQHDRAYEDLATKFFEHFAYIAAAIVEQGLWDEDDKFFYDVLHFGDGATERLRVRSVVGLLPLAATMTLGEDTLRALPEFAARFRWFLANKPRYTPVVGDVHMLDGHQGRLLAIVHRDRLVPILATVLSEDEFLSPHGLRALSRRHLAEPFTLHLDGASYSVDYEPGESQTGLFGGNSNWRGPVWFPVNYLLVEALRRFADFYGDDLRVEYPAGSGAQVTLTELADSLAGRLIAIFTDGTDGRRPVFGGDELFQSSPDWHDLIPFHEYFHGDDGHGLGASHQTGWTSLVAALLLERRRR
jgi:hypothetical protein